MSSEWEPRYTNAGRVYKQDESRAKAEGWPLVKPDELQDEPEKVGPGRPFAKPDRLKR